MANAYERVGTELAAITPELWSAKFQMALLANLPFKDFVARDYEGEIKALGDTVNISNLPQFSAATVMGSDDAAVDADAATFGNTQLIVNQMIVKDFIVTSQAMVQSLPAMNELRDMAIYAILEKLEALIVAAIVPNAAAPDHSISYVTGTTLALADIIAAKKLLDAQNVPQPDRTMVVGTSQYSDMFAITGFISKDFIPSGSPLSEGAINMPVLGFKVESTTKVANTSYFAHKSFLQLAVQKDPFIEVAPLTVLGQRGVRTNVSALAGIKQYSGLRVVSVS